MKSTGASAHVFLQVSVVVLCLASLNADTTTYTGVDTLGCTDGTCTLGGACGDPVVSLIPGTTDDNITFTGITGEIVIFPETCTAECEGCISTGADTDECLGSGGFVYCPELDECIRPWVENCPFEGDRFVGPIKLDCEEGFRCNDLTDECSIAIGSSTVGGPYLSGLEEGEYELPEGCLATCEGCTCVDENNCEILESAALSPVGNLMRLHLLAVASALLCYWL